MERIIGCCFRHIDVDVFSVTLPVSALLYKSKTERKTSLKCHLMTINGPYGYHKDNFIVLFLLLV